MKEKLLKNKYILPILLILLVVLVFFYFNWIFGASIAKNDMAKRATGISEANANPIFKIGKIILSSSADAIDNSTNKEVLQDLGICQYTDIGIYIDNKVSSDELTEKNTVKELYIDSINIQTNSNKGELILNYKNPLSFGRFKMLKNASNQRIDFSVVSTNRDNLGTNYNDPSFFTDCSNPISLGYINKNILRAALGGNNNAITFNGSILKATNITLNEIACTVNFKIHIINNLGEEYICNVNREILTEELDNSIYDGSSIRTIIPLEKSYYFIKVQK